MFLQKSVRETLMPLFSGHSKTKFENLVTHIYAMSDNT